MSILGGLVQGAFNYFAQKSANKTNIKLQQQANQANFDLYKEQVKDQEDWYNKYSSPLALRQQYEQAGFSPYAALDASGSSLNATPAPQEAAHVEPAKMDMMSALNAAMDLSTKAAQQNYIEQQAKGQQIANANADLMYQYNQHYLYGDKLFDKVSKLFNTWDRDKLASIYDAFDSALQTNVQDYKYLGSGEKYDNYVSRKRGLDLDLLEQSLQYQKSNTDYTDAKTVGQKLDNEVNNLGQLGNVFGKFMPIAKVLLQLLGKK